MISQNDLYFLDSDVLPCDSITQLPGEQHVDLNQKTSNDPPSSVLRYFLLMKSAAAARECASGDLEVDVRQGNKPRVGTSP